MPFTEMSPEDRKKTTDFLTHLPEENEYDIKCKTSIPQNSFPDRKMSIQEKIRDFVENEDKEDKTISTAKMIKLLQIKSPNIKQRDIVEEMLENVEKLNVDRSDNKSGSSSDEISNYANKFSNFEK